MIIATPGMIGGVGWRGGGGGAGGGTEVRREVGEAGAEVGGGRGEGWLRRPRARSQASLPGSRSVHRAGSRIRQFEGDPRGV